MSALDTSDVDSMFKTLVVDSEAAIVVETSRFSISGVLDMASSGNPREYLKGRQVSRLNRVIKIASCSVVAYPQNSGFKIFRLKESEFEELIGSSIMLLQYFTESSTTKAQFIDFKQRPQSSLALHSSALIDQI